MFKLAAFVLFGFLSYGAIGQGFGHAVGNLFNSVSSATGSHTVQNSGSIDVAFSPNAGAKQLVIKAINSAQRTILVAAYSFTDKDIAKALVAAKNRGVDVRAVLDKSQLTERYTAATFLANAGIPTRIDSQHAIAHSKYLVIDNETVETGSFNFTSSASMRNAENVVVIWKNHELANIYTNNWLEHWGHSSNYAARY